MKVWCWESGQRHPRPAPPHTTADLLSLDCEAARVLEAAGLGAALSERAHVLHRVGVEDDDAAVDRVGDEQRVRALGERHPLRAPKLSLLRAMTARRTCRLALEHLDPLHPVVARLDNVDDGAVGDDTRVAPQLARAAAWRAEGRHKFTLRSEHLKPEVDAVRDAQVAIRERRDESWHPKLASTLTAFTE